MKLFALSVAVALCATVLSAQDAPVVNLTSNGTPIMNSGSIEVAPNSQFNGAGIVYDIDDPQGDAVDCSAFVSNEAAAVNWTATEFNAPSQNTPWVLAITSPNGEFGPDGTVHVVTLTFSDGINDTIFSFTINVTSGGGGSGTPGSDGGGCVIAAPPVPWAFAVVVGTVLYFRRRDVTRA